MNSIGLYDFFVGPPQAGSTTLHREGFEGSITTASSGGVKRQAVTFTGADFSRVTAVTFETTPLTIPVPVAKAKLVVQVTGTVTSRFGHKELLALAGTDDNGKSKYIVLPLDVVKH